MARRKGLYRRGKYYWCRVDPVTRRAVSTRCQTQTGAEAWLAEREAVASGARDAAPTSQDRLGAWVQKILALKSETSSESTLEVYQQKLGHWVRLLGAEFLVSHIIPGTYDDYVARRRSEDVTDHTISKELVCMNQLLKLARRAGVWKGDVAAMRPMGVKVDYVPQKRALTRHEVVRLLAQLEPRRAAYAALCVGLGVRRSEVEKLLPSDFDWQRGQVFIGGTKTKKSRREVPILSIYRPLLEAAAPHLPVGKWGNGIRDLERACRRAGIDRCTRNDLRRTHSTLLHAEGVDRDTIRRLLGHSTTKMVDTVYAQPSPAALSVLAERQLVAVEPIAICYTDGQPAQANRSESGENPEKSHLSSVVEQRFRKPSALRAEIAANGLSYEKPGLSRALKRTRDGEGFARANTETLHAAGVLALALSMERAGGRRG